MSGQDKSTEVFGQSKFTRIKDSIERGRVMRRPSMDLNQLRRPSSFFKQPMLFQSHRKKNSVSSISEIDKDLQLTPSKSNSSYNSVKIDIASPHINTVSNFSPTKSINSLSSDSPMVSEDDQSPTRTNDIPVQFSISPIAEPIVSKSPEALRTSKFSRLKRKTISILFDQNEAEIAQKDIKISEQNGKSERPRSESIVSFAMDPARPKLVKALSDDKVPNLSDPGQQEDEDNTNDGSPRKELLRKRSRTLGSIENEIYTRRNSSLAKTIGSMVMLKPRRNTMESTHSSSGTSENSPTQIPEVEESDTEETYIEKLLHEGLENEITSILSERKDEFLKRCLTKYVENKFSFLNEPLDVSLRKFLMICELPKEAQQIDRVLSTFSERYYDNNPKIWDNPDQVYFITFSLVMLHTDHYNANNKRKMTKEEFVKNTLVDSSNPALYCASITKEILEYFYDNITFMKFIQKTRSLPQQPIYSLPKRFFSSASTTNLEAQSNGNQTLTPSMTGNRSYSLSSSTSQFFSSNQVDPYFHIIENDLESLRLDIDEVIEEDQEDPFSGRLTTALPEAYQDIKENIINSGGIYLRFNRDINWLTGKTDVKFLNEDEYADHETSNIIKVIKISELYREETVKNNKFFPMVSSSKVIWKKCYGFLTTCGLFIFDNLYFLAISDRQTILKQENLYSSEKMIFDVNFEPVLKSCSKLAINGLFAFSALETSENKYCFNLYSTNKKELFSNSTFEEMEDWILKINFIAALDSCFLDGIEYQNREVTSVRNITMEDKILKLSKNVPDLTKKAHELSKLQRQLRILTPFQVKTKESLVSYYKSLEKRLDWLWYEIGRNQVYLYTLNNEILNANHKDRISIRTDNDNESFLEESFINEDYNPVYKQSELGSVANGVKGIRLNLALSKKSTDERDAAEVEEGDEFFDALNDNL